MKLVGSKNKDVAKDKDGEDVPKLEFVELVLVHCDLLNNKVVNEKKNWNRCYKNCF